MNTLAIQEITPEFFVRLMQDCKFAEIAVPVGFETTENYNPKTPIDLDAVCIGAFDAVTKLELVDENTCRYGDLNFEIDKSRFFALSDARQEDEHFYFHIYANLFSYANGVKFSTPLPAIDFEVPYDFAQGYTENIWL